MCILLVALHCHPAFPFICAHNRDEEPDRPSAEDALEGDTSIICGRDRQAGGMVLGLNVQSGSVAMLTNCRSRVLHDKATTTSRGLLVEQLVAEGAEALDAMLESHTFNGFHVVAGRAMGPNPELQYTWNVPVEEDRSMSSASGSSARPKEAWAWLQGQDSLAQGVFVVSNENWSRNNLWPKSIWLKTQAERFLASLPKDVTSAAVMTGLEALMNTDHLPGLELPEHLPTYWEPQKEVFAQQRIFLPVGQSPDFGTVSQRILISDIRVEELQYFHRQVHEGLRPWQHLTVKWPPGMDDRRSQDCCSVAPSQRRSQARL
mmetsp:Transcript_34346/g.80386  ORF Transcript_34346/g.80386 Transcript_34346/m.80386 type:complete len:318 (-) Transcript_34346:110-1063(-)